LRPSDILIERFEAWKNITKNLIAYFEGELLSLSPTLLTTQAPKERNRQKRQEGGKCRRAQKTGPALDLALAYMHALLLPAQSLSLSAMPLLPAMLFYRRAQRSPSAIFTLTSRSLLPPIMELHPILNNRHRRH